MHLPVRSPLPAATVFWQPRAGRWICTVVCKATFLLRPGLSPLAPDQEPLLSEDVPWGNDPRYSLFAAGDLVPLKPRPEVLVSGSVWAPAGSPVPFLRARVAVGSLDKAVDVAGDRVFTSSGALTSPSPFVRMPLAWERAAGGPRTSNPAGVLMGASAIQDAWGRVAVPNLLPAGSALSGRRDVLPPVNLGPIAPGWPSRAARLPAHARGWASRSAREQPLPEGFDPWFFNAAPEDQELASLRGDERLLLEHLHPEFPRIETSLSTLSLLAVIAWMPGDRTEVDLRCDTLAIDTDRGRATLTYRAYAPVVAPGRAGEVIVTLRSPEPPASGQARSTTLEKLGVRQVEIERRSGELPPSEVAATVLLPCPPAPSRSPRQAVQDEEDDDDVALRTAPLDPASVRRWLPFVPAPAPDPSLRAAPPPTALASPTLHPASSRAPEAAPRLAGETASSALSTPSDPLSEPERWPAAHTGNPPQPPPQPPPWIGPLSPFISASDLTVEAPLVAVPADAPPAPEAGRPAPEPLPLTDYPLERCAAISASVARRPGCTPDLLTAQQLDLSTWQALRRHWDQVLRDELRRGRAGMLRAHDAALVAQIERERGPLRPEQLARLIVAAERDERDKALAELDLPRDVVTPIERVYLARMMDDATLRVKVRAALVSARRG